MLLADQVGERLLVEPGLEQPLVVLLQEVAVGEVGGLELDPEVLVLVGVLAEQRLHVPEVDAQPGIHERRDAEGGTCGTLFGPRWMPDLPNFRSLARVFVMMAGPPPRSSTPESCRPQMSK